MPPCSAMMRGVGPEGQHLAHVAVGHPLRVQAPGCASRAAGPAPWRRARPAGRCPGWQQPAGAFSATGALAQPASASATARAAQRSHRVTATARPATRRPGAACAAARAVHRLAAEGAGAEGKAQMHLVVHAGDGQHQRAQRAGRHGAQVVQAGGVGTVRLAPKQVQVERGDAGPHREVLGVEAEALQRRQQRPQQRRQRPAPAGSAGTGGCA